MTNNNNMEKENKRMKLIPTELKQSVKSRLFRGYYTERRYESTIQCYRDIVTLHKSEKELETLLNSVKYKAQRYNYFMDKSNVFIGISDNPVRQQGMLSTCIWVNLDNLAFGQYWFSIKTLHFLDNEIVVKLKVVRPVDLDAESTPERRKQSRTESSTAGTEDNNENSSDSASEHPLSSGDTSKIIKDNVNLDDFIEIFRCWAVACKKNAYAFLANDINKENIKNTIRFIGLLLVSLITFAIVGIKDMGTFVLRFMHAFSNLIKVLTPIFCKVIDFLTKIIGGIFILISMMFGGRPAPSNQRTLERLQYKSRY